MPTTHRLRHAIETTARAIDRCPIAPASLANRALDHWVTSSQQARAEGSWGAVGDEDWLTHFRHEREIPDPRWVSIARKIGTMQAASLVRAVRRPWQRARRGFADEDLWNADLWLSRIAGGMLDQLATQAHGWPDDVYDTYDEWVTALRVHAAALERYVEGEDRELLNTWFNLITDPASESEDIKGEWDALNRADAVRERDASEAWQWIAEHHQRLWD